MDLGLSDWPTETPDMVCSAAVTHYHTLRAVYTVRCHYMLRELPRPTHITQLDVAGRFVHAGLPVAVHLFYTTERRAAPRHSTAEGLPPLRTAAAHLPAVIPVHYLSHEWFLLRRTPY